MQAWIDEAGATQFVDLAQENTRYLLNPLAQTIEEAKAMHARLRKRMESASPSR